MSEHATHLYPPSEAFSKQAHVSGRAAYDRLAAEARDDYEGYWGRLGRELERSLVKDRGLVPPAT